MGRDPGPARRRRRGNPALQAHRRRHSGELLVRGEAQGSGLEVASAASFNALQQRLGRKNVSQKMLGSYPAFVRLYDVLFENSEDLRELAWEKRRSRLETFAARLDQI